MESARDEYYARMERAHAAERDGLYRIAVEWALSAWGFIDGMMQFERRYEKKEFASVVAIDIVLRYAPLLLDSKSLDTLESLLRESKRIERITSDDMGEKLATAREQMWLNHRLWSHLEATPGARQDELRQVLGGEQHYWRDVSEIWAKMGLLKRQPDGGSYRLNFSTRMGELTHGKCPACGKVVEAPKAMFFDDLTCPQCRTSAAFVLVA